MKNNRQRVYRVLAAINDADRLELFLGTSTNTVQYLRQMMTEGVVDFVFRKESTSELVRRRGTLHPDVLAHWQYSPERQGTYRNPTLLTYWDVDKPPLHPWGQACADRLVGYFVHSQQWSDEIISELLEKLEN